MKCIKKSDGTIKRVSDEVAYKLINDGEGYTYCPKEEWKAQRKEAEKKEEKKFQKKESEISEKSEPKKPFKKGKKIRRNKKQSGRVKNDTSK